MKIKIFALAAAFWAAFLLPAFGQSFPGKTLGITPASPTISSGAITVTSGTVAPVPESGTIDTIVTINGGQPGETIVVKAPSGNSLLLDNGAGNLVLRADAFLDDNDSITLKKIGSNWVEISRNVESFEGGNVSYDTIYEMARHMASSPLDADTPREGGTATINGQAIPYSFVIKKGDTTISSFTSSDWFIADADDTCAFVIVNGDLTIDSGQTLIPSTRKLCQVVYVTGNLTNNGGISMTARGANHSASGSNVPAVAIALDGTHTIPATCGTGATGAARTTSGTTTGSTGQSASGGSCTGSGGGGSGANLWSGASGGTSTAGSGAQGTAFSGGPGGGGVYHASGSTSSPTAGSGGANGGAGGDAAATSQGAHAGIGNPTGTSAGSAGESQSSGTGGTLVVMVEGTVSGSGTVTANGVDGTDSTNGNRTGGGGSGGGIAWLFYGSDSSSITPAANGGDGGEGASGGSDSNARDGGSGGDGYAAKEALSGASVWDGWEGVAPEVFIGLDDTPFSYSGKASYLPQVNSGETGLDFVDPNDLSITTTQTGSVARALDSHLSDVVNVKNFGAVGDCTATTGTDDTAAIQAASAVSGTLFFPPGNYCITELDWTDLTSYKTIIGHGAFLYATDSDVTAVIDMLTTQGIRVYGLGLRTQTGVSPRIGWQLGRLANAGNHYEFNGVSVKGTYDHAAFVLAPSDFSTFTQLEVENDSSTATSYALEMSSQAGLFQIRSDYEDYADNGSLQNINARVVTNITQANPGVVTIDAAHDLETGNCTAGGTVTGCELIRFRNVGGMTELNSVLKTATTDDSKVFCAIPTSSTAFSIYERDCTTTVDTTAFSAWTSGGFVGPYSSNNGTSQTTFINSDFICDSCRAAIFGPSLTSATFLNSYFRSQLSATDNATVYFYGDHDAGHSFETIHFDASVESGTVDHGFSFMAESTFFPIRGFTGRDESAAFGGAYFYTVSGMTIDLIGYNFTLNQIQTDTIFSAGFRLTGIANWIGQNASVGSGMDISGLPDMAGIITGYDANDYAFDAGTSILFTLYMNESAINYIPVKGEMRFFGGGSDTYSAETIDLESDITKISGDFIQTQNDGLRILDSNASHSIIFSSDSNVTADRTLDINVPDADMDIAFADAGADAIWGWDDSAGTYTNLSAADALAATGGANTALSNLATVAINTSLVSDTDDTDALGSASIGWADLFLGGGGGSIKFGNDETIADGTNLLAFTGAENYVFNHTAALTTPTAAMLQVVGTTFATAAMATYRFSNDNSHGSLIFGKSRSGSVGTYTVVQNGDTLGAFLFYGADGTDMALGGSVRGEVDGTPGNNDMPMRLQFNTTSDGTQAQLERLRIDSKGHMEFVQSSPPTLSSCGTSPSADTGSADHAGRITVGTSLAADTTCTVTFSGAFNNAPNCYAINETDSRLVAAVATTSAITITDASLQDSDVISYQCQAYNG